IVLDKKKKHRLSVVIDRMSVREGIQQRLSDSVETALKLADGVMEVQVIGGETKVYSEKFSCPDCGISLPEIEPRLFSFNAPYGACPTCGGLGINREYDWELILPDKDKSFADGAIAAMSSNQASFTMRLLNAFLLKNGYTLDNCWNDLKPAMRQKLQWGAGTETFQFVYTNLNGDTNEYNRTWDGVIPMLKQRYREAWGDAMREDLESFMSGSICPDCHGSRLKPEVLSILVGGKNIDQVVQMTVRDAKAFFAGLQLSNRQQVIAKQVLKEINARLNFLNDVGLDYLTLSRAAATLSGGEAQRIRLATQIGSGLVGVLY
ncbi:MAG: excinuclease ABC subunit UvrA, partial [Succiniclasticum sp.]